jgi:hypothetical protein
MFIQKEFGTDNNQIRICNYKNNTTSLAEKTNIAELLHNFAEIICQVLISEFIVAFLGSDTVKDFNSNTEFLKLKFIRYNA